jgi:threonine/homoserine/homoserine lactone efflux protein
MLNLDTLLTFIIASTIIAVAPGPSNAFLMAQTFTKGRTAGMQSAFGFAMGGVIHTLFAVIGLSALLKTSPIAYSTVQYLGAAYLGYLGIMTIRSSLRAHNRLSNQPHINSKNTGNIFVQAMMTEVLNPKVALFFIAFIPQFVDPSLSSTTTQLAILGLLYPILAFPIDCAYVYTGDKIAHYFKKHPQAPLWIDRASGLIFVALAINLLI